MPKKLTPESVDPLPSRPNIQPFLSAQRERIRTNYELPPARHEQAIQGVASYAIKETASPTYTEADKKIIASIFEHVDILRNSKIQ